MVKATMRAASVQPAARQAPHHQSPRTQPAVLKSAKHRLPAGTRIASTSPAPQLPVLDQRTVVILTEMTTPQLQPRAVLAVSTDRRSAPVVPLRATYAIVPTPNGWLIIRI
jgi:hypothetical protein